jgi:hypothetical protein
MVGQRQARSSVFTDRQKNWSESVRITVRLSSTTDVGSFILLTPSYPKSDAHSTTGVAGLFLAAYGIVTSPRHYIIDTTNLNLTVSRMASIKKSLGFAGVVLNDKSGSDAAGSGEDNIHDDDDSSHSDQYKKKQRVTNDRHITDFFLEED